MKSAIALIVAVSIGGILSPLLRPSNSRALSEKGLEQFANGEYGVAAQLFESAREVRPTAETTFDLGTSLVAAKSHETGEELLLSLAGDETLAAASWYNAGNSQLVRGALDEAIASYTETLRIAPTNMSAKRNLEIALQRQEQQQSGGSGEGDDEEQEEEQSPAPGDQQDGRLDPDLESVLRSIEQQEQEELSRMRRSNAMRRPADW